MAWASAEPSTGSVPDASSSRRTSDRSVAVPRISTRFRTCPENVDRLISIDCWSPMSASTWSNTGSAALWAGGRRPAWWSSAARPSVLRATVFPPAFGPLTTSARRESSSTSIGTAATGSRSGWRAPRSVTSSAGSTGAPRQARETIPPATTRSIAAVASTSAATSSAAAPTRTDSSRRMRSTSSRSAPAASDWTLFSSTTSNGSTKSVWPELEASCTMPGTLRRALAFTASTGRPPRWVTKSSCRCSRSSLLRARRRSSSATRWRPSRSSFRRRRSFGEALSRTSEPSSSIARWIASASGASVGSIAVASSCRSGAVAACSSSAARASTPPAIAAATSFSVSGASTPPLAAWAAPSRTSRIPRSGGSSASSSSAIASAVRAWRRVTSAASALGASARASSAP